MLHPYHLLCVFLLLLAVAQHSFANLLPFEGVFSDDSYPNGKLRLCRDGFTVRGTYTYDDRPVGVVRGTVSISDGQTVFESKWYEPSGSWGGGFLLWDAETSPAAPGFEGYWYFNDAGTRQFHHGWGGVLLDSERPSDEDCAIPHESSFRTLDIAGEWYGIGGLESRLCVVPFDEDYRFTFFVSAGYGVFGEIPRRETLYASGDYFADAGILSGIWYDQDGTLGSLLGIIRVEDVIDLILFGDTGLSSTVLSVKMFREPDFNTNSSVADCRPEPSSRRLSQKWNGRYEGLDMMNLNGRLYGHYYPEDEDDEEYEGLFVGEVLEDGASAEGFWYEVAFPPFNFGRFTYQLVEEEESNAIRVVGYWSIGNETVVPGDDNHLGNPSGQLKISEGVTSVMAHVLDDMEGTVSGTWSDCIPQESQDVEVPRYICADAGSYWKDDGLMSSNLVRENGKVMLGTYGEMQEGEERYGVFLNFAMFNGVLRGIRRQLTPAWTNFVPGTTVDGPYNWNSDAVPEKCIANQDKFTLPTGFVLDRKTTWIILACVLFVVIAGLVCALAVVCCCCQRRQKLSKEEQIGVERNPDEPIRGRDDFGDGAFVSVDTVKIGEDFK